MHKQTEIKVKFDKGHLSPLIKKKKISRRSKLKPEGDVYYIYIVPASIILLPWLGIQEALYNWHTQYWIITYSLVKYQRGAA